MRLSLLTSSALAVGSVILPAGGAAGAIVVASAFHPSPRDVERADRSGEFGESGWFVDLASHAHTTQIAMPRERLLPSDRPGGPLHPERSGVLLVVGRGWDGFDPDAVTLVQAYSFNPPLSVDTHGTVSLDYGNGLMLNAGTLQVNTGGPNGIVETDSNGIIQNALIANTTTFTPTSLFWNGGFDTFTTSIGTTETSGTLSQQSNIAVGSTISVYGSGSGAFAPGTTITAVTGPGTAEVVTFSQAPTTAIANGTTIEYTSAAGTSNNGCVNSLGDINPSPSPACGSQNPAQLLLNYNLTETGVFGNGTGADFNAISISNTNELGMVGNNRLLSITNVSTSDPSGDPAQGKIHSIEVFTDIQHTPPVNMNSKLYAYNSGEITTRIEYPQNGSAMQPQGSINGWST